MFSPSSRSPFFVSSVSLQIVDGNGDPHVATEAENAAQRAAGVAAALLLGKGDSLVFDLDNDHALDPNEALRSTTRRPEH